MRKGSTLPLWVLSVVLIGMTVTLTVPKSVKTPVRPVSQVSAKEQQYRNCITRKIGSVGVANLTQIHACQQEAYHELN